MLGLVSRLSHYCPVTSLEVGIVKNMYMYIRISRGYMFVRATFFDQLLILYTISTSRLSIFDQLLILGILAGHGE